MVRQRGGGIHYQLATDYIRFTCTTCAFGEAIKQTPSLCYLIGTGLWCGAVQCFGYGKVVFKKRIAVGDDHCDIRVYLKKTAEVDSGEGIADVSAPDPSLVPVGADVSMNETVRHLRARIRYLERRIEELEDALEERKLIERAKGILMERLKRAELQVRTERQSRQSREMAILTMIGNAIGGSLALNEILDQALDATLASLEMEAGEIFLLDAVRGEVRKVRHRGQSRRSSRNAPADPHRLASPDPGRHPDRPVRRQENRYGPPDPGFPPAGWGGVQFLSILFGAIGVLTAGVGLLPPLPVVIAPLFLMMAAMGLSNGALFQVIPQRFRNKIGIATGIVGATGGIGGFCLPLLLGLLKDLTGS